MQVGQSNEDSMETFPAALSNRNIQKCKVVKQNK